MAKANGYYYIIDLGYDPMICVAKNDTAFMNYFIDNIDEFKDLFTSMYLTESEFQHRFPKIYGRSKKYSAYDDWDYCKEKFCRELRDMSFKEFVDELEGKCNDGNDTPYVCITRRKQSEVMYI